MVLVVHKVIQSALNCFHHLSCWMQDCVLRALLIKSVFSLHIVCISFLWAVWTKIMLQKKHPKPTLKLHYIQKMQETRSEEKVLLRCIFKVKSIILSKRWAYLQTMGVADERNLRHHLWFTEPSKENQHHTSSPRNWTVETTEHKLCSENGACSKISELQNAKLIALACAHSFCFTYKNASTHELSLFLFSDSVILPFCWGRMCEWLHGA